MHLLYLLTPYFKNLKEPNWEAFIRVFKNLSKADLAVAEMYQINQEYMEWARQIRPQLPAFITERNKAFYKSRVNPEENLDDLKEL